jgi:hypothetical protein
LYLIYNRNYTYIAQVHYTKVVEFNSRIPTKLVWHFSKFSTNFYKFLKFIAFELRGGALEFYKDALRTFEIVALIPLARRGRRAEVVPAKFR